MGEKGTGFGLPLLNETVLSLGGAVKIESSEDPEDHGTRFILTLPT